MKVSADDILHLYRVPASVAFLSMFCLPLASLLAYTLTILRRRCLEEIK